MPQFSGRGSAIPTRGSPVTGLGVGELRSLSSGCYPTSPTRSLRLRAIESCEMPIPTNLSPGFPGPKSI
jgi:hypothetical protein